MHKHYPVLEQRPESDPQEYSVYLPRRTIFRSQHLEEFVLYESPRANDPRGESYTVLMAAHNKNQNTYFWISPLAEPHERCG